MSYGVDNRGGNPHINFEPSSVAGLQKADDSYREYRPPATGGALARPVVHNGGCRDRAAGNGARTAGSASAGDYVSCPRRPCRCPAPRPGRCPAVPAPFLPHLPGEVS
jgi:hypothetical protein